MFVCSLVFQACYGYDVYVLWFVHVNYVPFCYFFGPPSISLNTIFIIMCRSEKDVTPDIFPMEQKPEMTPKVV